MTSRICIFILVCFTLTGCAATKEESFVVRSDQINKLYNTNDASTAQPWGRVHPTAPDEASQFDFLVGKFLCTDRSLQSDGSWKESKATWVTRYILNGNGVKDDYRTDVFAGTSIRVFDVNQDAWRVAFYGMPGNFYGLEWKGKKEADNMVMRREYNNASGAKVESVLTFYEITEAGFEWKNWTKIGAAQPVTSWEISCTRQ